MNAVRPSTGALCAPAQDEAIFFVPSKFYLFLNLRPQDAPAQMQRCQPTLCD
jgi:hypothetical protein